MNIILTVIGLLLVVMLTSAIFMLGLVDPRSTKVSESAKGFMTLAYCIFDILLAIIAELSIVKWDKANYNKIISSKDLYRLDTRTGYWVNIDTNTEIKNIDYRDVIEELEYGEPPVIREIKYGDKYFYNKRNVKVIAAEQE